MEKNTTTPRALRAALGNRKSRKQVRKAARFLNNQAPKK